MATSGVGTVFSRSDMASSPTFSAIAEVNSIQGPNMSRSTIDTTSLDTTGGYRTFVASFRDGGQVQLEMNFTAAGYSAMKTDFESDTAVNYRITLPDSSSTVLAFAGLVTDLGLGVPTDDKVSAPVTIKISGQVELNPSS